MGENNNTPIGGPPVQNLSSYRRVVIGRNITLTLGAVYALSRSYYYATINPDALSTAQNVITVNGVGLGTWAGLWLFAAVLCIADMVNRHTRYGLPFIVGLAAGWGCGYLIMWGWNGFTDGALISSAISWLTPSLLVLGFIIKVSGLYSLIKELQALIAAAKVAADE